MKKLFSIFIVTFFQICFSSMVLVHTGSPIPSYTHTCIAQIRKFNPTINVYMIADQKYIDCLAEEKFKSQDVTVIYSEVLPQNKRHIKFKKETSLDHNFRDAFWQKTTERFFLIEELMEQLQLTNVFHIENDVLIYFNIDEYIETFKSYEHIAAVFDNDDRCIASLIFFRTPKSIKNLTKFIANHSRDGLNDMQIIALFKNRFGQQFIDHLPIISPTYINKYSLKNNLGASTKNPENYCKNFELFNAVFDAASLGQYLGGADPIHHIGPGFVNESCLFDPSKLKFFWQKDKLARNIPYAMVDDNVFKINTLHIHCKNLLLFQS